MALLDVRAGDLRISWEVVDPADFGAMVGEASDLCPVSRLLAGAKITVDAALEPAS